MVLPEAGHRDTGCRGVAVGSCLLGTAEDIEPVKAVVLPKKPEEGQGGSLMEIN